jgi:NADH dehydrogenase
VLVTGANGHLGRRLLRRFAEGAPRAPVRAVVRSERAADVLRALPDALRPEIAILDWSDADALARAAVGCAAAVHLVGILKESASSRYADAHEGACQALVRAAAKAGLRRIVHVSVLGADPASTNACLASRGRADRILLAGSVPAVVLRVPMVIGEGDHAARTLRAQTRARVVPLLRGGAAREQPIDARDVVRAVVLALAAPGMDGGVALDLAGPESLTRRDLLMRCAALYGRHPRVISVPLGLELAVAGLLERLLADPPVTRAMLGVLARDDEIDPSDSCRRLGLTLTPLGETLRRCVGPGSEPA